MTERATPPGRRAFLGAAVAAGAIGGRDAMARDGTETVQRAEPVAELALPLGNAAYTPAGRLFVSHHPMFETERRVSEVVDGRLHPFPDAAWNAPRPGSEDYLDGVLGIRADRDGVVWMLDMGTRTGITPKLVGWDTRTDRLAGVVALPPPATVRTSEPNDFVLDPRRGLALIADEGVGNGGDGTRAALIVVDLAAGTARRRLEGHAAMRPEHRPIAPEGTELRRTPKEGGEAAPMRVGCDGIALDRAGEWLYFGPLNGGTLYRLRMADLLDAALDDAGLGARVEAYAERPDAGGIAVDDAGNLYLTEVAAGAVGVIPAEGRRYRRLATHPDLLWPDGIFAAPDGTLHVTAAQLFLAAPLNGGRARHAPPYRIFRFRPLAGVRPGD